jgi:hypothetical protein
VADAAQPLTLDRRHRPRRDRATCMAPAGRSSVGVQPGPSPTPGVPSGRRSLGSCGRWVMSQEQGDPLRLMCAAAGRRTSVITLRTSHSHRHLSSTSAAYWSKSSSQRRASGSVAFTGACSPARSSDRLYAVRPWRADDLAAELGIDEGNVRVLLRQLGEQTPDLPDDLVESLRRLLNPA